MTTAYTTTIPVNHPVMEWMRGVDANLRTLYIGGGYVRDSIAGVPFCDLDFLVTDVDVLSAVRAALDRAGVPYEDMGLKMYRGIQFELFGTAVDVVANMNVDLDDPMPIDRADFDVNCLVADLYTGMVYGDPAIVDAIHDRVMRCIDCDTCRIQQYRFAHMIVDKGYTLGPCVPNPNAPDARVQLTTYAPYDPTAPTDMTRLSAVRDLLKSGGYFATGPDAMVLVGAGGGPGLVDRHELCIYIGGIGGPDPDLAPQIVWEENRVVHLLPYDPATFFSPVTFGSIRVSFDGTILNWDDPGACDLLGKVCRLQSCASTECGDLVARFADDYTMVNGMPCPGCLVADGFAFIV